MLPIDSGFLYRNGHGRCGGCRCVVDSTRGGRRARKREGWTYTGRDAVGWVCRVCALWARRPEPLRPADPRPEAIPDPIGLAEYRRRFGTRHTLARVRHELGAALAGPRARAIRRKVNRRRNRGAPRSDAADMKPSEWVRRVRYTAQSEGPTAGT